MAVRVRCAPSPTGQVHIGNICTAIFNRLFARHGKEEFLLRIADTDLERSTQDAVGKLMKCMTQLGQAVKRIRRALELFPEQTA